MCWVDYKQAFDSVLATWLNSICTGSLQGITEFFEKCMATWRTALKAGQSVIDSVSRIFQGDVISSLLFCIVLAPLSFLLQPEKLGTSFRDGQVINHLRALYG